MKTVILIVLPILFLLGTAGKLTEAKIYPHYSVDIFLPLGPVPQSIVESNDAECMWQAKVITVETKRKILIFSNLGNDSDPLVICYLNSKESWYRKSPRAVTPYSESVTDGYFEIKSECGRDDFDRFGTGNWCYRDVRYEMGK